jgi:hypothetical protein
MTSSYSVVAGYCEDVKNYADVPVDERIYEKKPGSRVAE